MKLRHYRHPEDYGRVWAFLVETYDPNMQPSNWLAPRWEYMFYLCVPMFGVTAAELANIGIWEDDGEIVGVVHFEERLGEAYFQIRPGYGRIKPDMLAHAESHLAEMLPDGTHSLQAYINDWDEELIAAARARGYVREEGFTLYMSRFDARNLPATIPLPAGFALQSLAEDNDLAKLTRCLHRGFDHAGKPPEEKAETMRTLQTAPSFRKDLNIVVVARAASSYPPAASGTCPVAATPWSSRWRPTPTTAAWAWPRRPCWRRSAAPPAWVRPRRTWPPTRSFTCRSALKGCPAGMSGRRRSDSRVAGRGEPRMARPNNGLLPVWR